jgi:hypothetical protein
MTRSLTSQASHASFDPFMRNLTIRLETLSDLGKLPYLHSMLTNRTAKSAQGEPLKLMREQLNDLLNLSVLNNREPIGMYNALLSYFDFQASLIIIAFATGKATITKPRGFLPAGSSLKQKTGMHRLLISTPIDHCLVCLPRRSAMPVHLQDPTFLITQPV